MLYLQPVTIPTFCFLEEVLLWAAVQRLPTASYFGDVEWRESDEIEGYAVDLNSELEDGECARLGVPPDPRHAAMVEGTATLPLAHYDEFLAADDLGRDFRTKLIRERQESLAFHRALADWKSQYEAAIEYPASRVFVGLREGRLKASGRLLPDGDPQTALDNLEAAGRYISDIPVEEIPATFWTLSGIDWAASAARGDGRHYCWIRCGTKEVLSVLPADRQPISGVEQVGDFFVLDESGKERPLSVMQRGRPPFRWDLFHLEIADLLRRGALPEKKEAAIQLIQDWFERTLSQKPSRAAIGEKLKPYYDRFIRSKDRK